MEESKKINKLPGRIILISIIMFFLSLALSLVVLAAPKYISVVALETLKTMGFAWLPIFITGLVLATIEKYKRNRIK